MRLPQWAQGQSGGVLASCLVHGVLLFSATGVITQPPRYEVQAGWGGAEVSLVAAPLPSAATPAAAPQPAIPEVPKDAVPTAADDWRLEEIPLPPPQEAVPEPAAAEVLPADAAAATASPYVGDGSSPIPGQDPTTLYLQGGALTGQGHRFKNPAPPYPYAAIRQQQQGTVLLKATIDKAGRPVTVEVMESSGFSLLDDSALRTVRRWKFDPAHIGFLPVHARIVIPIRFTLDERLTDLDKGVW